MYAFCLFAPLAWERAAVLAGFSRRRQCSPNQWRAQIDRDHEAIVVQSGMGYGRAADAARAAPEARCMVVVGCAGGLVEGLECGAIVIADRVEEGGRSQTFPTVATPLVEWVQASGMRARRGTILTVERPIREPDAKRRAGASGALAVDMESAAIVREAGQRRIPVVVVRVILDGIGDALPDGNVIDETTGRIRLSGALRAFARPNRWALAIRMARQQLVVTRVLTRLTSRLFGADGVGVRNALAPLEFDRLRTGA